VWDLVFIVGCLVGGIVIARWLLLPLPVAIVWFVYDVFPPDPNDDLSGIANLIRMVVGTFVLAVGIYAGKLVRQPGKRPKPPDPTDNT